MGRWLCAIVFLCAASGPVAPHVRGDDYPQFRGPGGQGHAVASDLPISWSESENIAWKTELPGRGWSSPTIAGAQIWLTAAVEKDGNVSLRVLGVDRESGMLQQDLEVFQIEKPAAIHSKNSHASPTPVIAGDRVYVHFGAHGTAALDRSGKVLWKTRLEYEHQHGPAGSPVVAGPLLYLNCDGVDKQFVVALDKDSGDEVWRAPRAGRHAYSTPLLIDVDGKQQLISVSGEWAFAYDPTTGEELWKVNYPEGYSNVPRPVYGHGLVFISSGYNSPVLYAIKPDGRGDVTATHVAWKLERNAPLNPSPLLIGDELYVVSDNGILSCLEARTGDVHWRQRIDGNYSASPVFADGRVYVLNEEGLCTVFEPSKDEYRELAANRLPGQTLASPAITGSAIYLRTDSALYRIER